jgi:hypothetical protein
MRSGPKKVALWLLIASVAVSALLGIWAILSGDSGWLQERILLSTLTLTGASICSLACATLWESGRIRLVPQAGILLAGIGAVLVIIGIWRDVPTDSYGKLTIACWFLAVATAHACLLSLARLSSRFAWVLLLAYGLIYLLAGLGIYLVFASPTDNDFYRLAGVVAILVGAISLIVPILHRLSAADPKTSEILGLDPLQLWATVTCPRCGTPQANSRAEINCENCRCRFRIVILPNTAAEVPALISVQ